MPRHSYSPLSFNNIALERGLGVARDAWKVHFASSIGSTMDIVNWCARSGVKQFAGHALCAAAQTGGTGQHGAWRSSLQDVKLTVAIPAAKDETEFALFNAAAPLSVIKTLNELCAPLGGSGKPKFGVKLLNDVLTKLNTGNFEKISGSLGVGKQDPVLRGPLATKLNANFPDSLLIIGIGINLGLRDYALNDPRIPPTSFTALTGTTPNRDEVTGILLRHLSQSIELVRSNPSSFCQQLTEALLLGPEREAKLVMKKDQTQAEHMVTVDRIEIGELVLSDGVRVPLIEIQRLTPLGLKILTPAS